jgi:hypothetical protein
MRQAGVRGCMRGRRGGTTHRSKKAAPAEDLLKPHRERPELLKARACKPRTVLKAKASA